MTERGYEFSGYLDDDAEKLHNIISDAWEKGDLGDKTLFFYDEGEDPALFRTSTGEVAVRIYADETISEPRGIGFDSQTEERTMRIDIRGINRLDTMHSADQIRLILVNNRIRPFGHWQTMWCSTYYPVYPSFKYYHTTMQVKLKKYYVAMTNVNSYGVSQYSRE